MSLPEMISTWVTAFGVPSLVLVAPLQHACHIVSSIHIIAGSYAGPSATQDGVKNFIKVLGNFVSYIIARHLNAWTPPRLRSTRA